MLHAAIRLTIPFLSCSGDRGVLEQQPAAWFCAGAPSRGPAEGWVGSGCWPAHSHSLAHLLSASFVLVCCKCNAKL